jgi:hypothetical protein
MLLARIVTPWYDVEGRKYINLDLGNGQVIRAKVPWRYGRVMCKVSGIRPIQELELNETVEVILDKKYWGGNVYHVIISLRSSPLV